MCKELSISGPKFSPSPIRATRNRSMKRLRSEYDDDLLSAGIRTTEDMSTEGGMTMAQHVPALNLNRQSFLSSMHDFPNTSKQHDPSYYVPQIPNSMLRPDSE